MEQVVQKYPEVCAKMQLAVLSGAMDRRLQERYGLKAAFVGKSPDIAVVARQFAQCLGEDDRCWIPVGNRTLGRFRDHIPEKKRFESQVYEVQIREREQEPCDGIFFTSPSNADGFFHSGWTAFHGPVWAMGVSTARRLEAGNMSPFVPENFESESIIKLFEPLLK